MVVLALASFHEIFSFNKPVYTDGAAMVSFESDSVKTKKKARPAKKDVAPSPRKDTAKATSADENAKRGVIITTSGTEPSIENLKEDEIYVPATSVSREYVLEEDFKLWRIHVQKGRKTTTYRKVEVPFGTFYKKNQMDITEEFYNLETKDLPEGEVKRYMRDEFEAKERQRIEEELRNLYEIKTVPMDSAFNSNPEDK